MSSSETGTAQLDRPIFLVGHARGGSTLLGGILNWHSQIGPKPPYMQEMDSAATFIDSILASKFHYDYAAHLEQKPIWFDYFPGEKVFSTMGKEIICEDPPIQGAQLEEFYSRLTEEFQEDRFLSKAPTNSFRVKAIRKLFPNCKIIALYRSGPEVVSSYMNWEVRSTYRKLGFIKGIRVIGRKWCETIEYLESARAELGILPLKYDWLIESPVETLEMVLRFCDLPFEDYIGTVKVSDRRSAWKKKIPWVYHPWLHYCTSPGMKLYNSITIEEARRSLA